MHVFLFIQQLPTTPSERFQEQMEQQIPVITSYHPKRKALERKNIAEEECASVATVLMGIEIVQIVHPLKP